jgi:hypothetical protein
MIFHRRALDLSTVIAGSQNNLAAAENQSLSDVI